LSEIENNFVPTFMNWNERRKTFSPDDVNQGVFSRYSAYEVTHTLSGLLEMSLGNSTKST
jgi:hypothetical protein